MALFGGGSITEFNPVYMKLTSIFDDDDAEHILHALMAKCDYFVTFDKKTILNRAAKYHNEVQKLFDTLRLASPEDAVRMIESARSKG